MQGSTFCFVLSIPFIALPMHSCCTIFQADLGSLCITLFRWSALRTLSNPKTLTTTLVANIQIKRISCTVPIVGGRLGFVRTRGCFLGWVINPSAFLSSLDTVHAGTCRLLFFWCSVGVLVLWPGPRH